MYIIKSSLGVQRNMYVTCITPYDEPGHPHGQWSAHIRPFSPYYFILEFLVPDNAPHLGDRGSHHLF